MTEGCGLVMKLIQTRSQRHLVHRLCKIEIRWCGVHRVAAEDEQEAHCSRIHIGDEFREAGAPKGGVSLWTYGTPGERYFAGWVWHAEGAQTGRLQIDIAAAGYELADIATAPIKL